MLELELAVLRSVLQSVGALYWLLAAGAVLLALTKGRRARSRAAWAAFAVAVFAVWPGTLYVEQYHRAVYERAAWAYFKKKCETEAGEKIYKTFTGVKSVLVIKPLPPATEKDNFDQFWYGDPYSSSPHSQRGLLEAAILASPVAPVSYGKPGRGFDFVEVKHGGAEPLLKLRYPSDPKSGYVSVSIEQHTSRFAVSWEDISTPEDRKYWVGGSRLRITDRLQGDTIAERVGYLIEPGFGSREFGRRPWLVARSHKTSCPSITSESYQDRFFILKVLKPSNEVNNGQ